MWLFYFFAAICLWMGVLSLRGGFRFSRYLRKQLVEPIPDFSPAVSVIAPLRGADPGLENNLAALLQQDYPDYEIIFVSDRTEDSALDVVRTLLGERSSRRSSNERIVIAGKATDSGQKVHNLRTAIAEISPRSEVLAFVDSDVQPDENWLRSLVSPLADNELGATTGYRWYVATGRGFAPHLRSVWNASITSALGAEKHKNFCWGGSTAIKIATFNQLKMHEQWRGTVSDDFALTAALQKTGLPIHFVPACLVPSAEDCTARQLFEFSNRQLKITRVYAAHLWKPVLIGSLIFTLVFFGGISLIAWQALQGRAIVPAAILLLLIFILGAAKSYIRLRAVSLFVTRYRPQSAGSVLAHLLLWPLASVLYLGNSLAALFSRRIQWRGITYELKSRSDAVIIARND